MLIDPRPIGFDLTAALRAYVEARVENELRHFAPAVLKVTIRLEDVNGDHGGIDKHCSIVAMLRRRRVVVAEATDANLYNAIDQAGQRIRHSVRRALTKWSAHERKSPQRPGSLWQVHGRYNVHPQVRVDTY